MQWLFQSLSSKLSNCRLSVDLLPSLESNEGKTERRPSKVGLSEILCLSLSQFSGTKSWKTQAQECSFEKWEKPLHWSVKSNVTLVELDRMLKIATLHRRDIQRFVEKCLRHGIAPNRNKPNFALSFQSAKKSLVQAKTDHIAALNTARWSGTG